MRDTSNGGRFGVMQMADTLYRQVLGERFAALHPILQAFHSSPHGGRAAGTFRVLRGRTWLLHCLATLGRFPPAADAVRVQLKVTPFANGERWVRDFGGHRMVTIQTAQGGLLVESAGPMSIGFHLEVTNGGLRFHRHHVWLGNLRCPPRLAPVITAAVLPDDRGWTAQVAMELPLLGQLVRYEGYVVPQ